MLRIAGGYCRLIFLRHFTVFKLSSTITSPNNNRLRYPLVAIYSLLLIVVFSGSIVNSHSYSIAIYAQEQTGAELNRDRINTEMWASQLELHHLTSSKIKGITSLRRLKKYDLLIIPTTTPLSDKETRIILSFLESGKSLIICEGTGEKTSGEITVGLAQQLGLAIEKLPPDSPASWKIIYDTPQFLTANLSRLQTIYVQREHSRITRTQHNVSAFWINPTFRNEDLEFWKDSAAIVKGEYGKGRFVWIGFGLPSIGSELPNSEAFYRFSFNLLAWLQRLPVVEKNAWPSNYKAAATLSMDTETAFSNLNRKIGIEELPPYTLFILADPAKMFLQTLRELAQDSRIEIAVHGDNHDVFKGQPYKQQYERLAGTKRFLKQELNVDVVGFRPPEEEYDFFTLEALVNAGYRYFFADTAPDRTEPKIMNVSGCRLVQFPKFNDDDIRIIQRPKRTDIAEIFEVYKKDIDKIVSREGLYMGNYHTHVLVNPQNIEVLRKIALYLQENQVWTPTIVEVVDWWLARHNINIQQSDVDIKDNHHTMTVLIDNHNRHPVDNFTFSLWFPAEIKKTPVVSLVDGSVLSSISMTANRLSVVSPTLNPFSRKEFEIVWQDSK